MQREPFGRNSAANDAAREQDDGAVNPQASVSRNAMPRSGSAFGEVGKWDEIARKEERCDEQDDRKRNRWSC